MERKIVNILVAAALVFLVATSFGPSAFAESEKVELRSDGRNDHHVDTAKMDVSYPYSLSNVIVEDNTLGIQFCGLCLKPGVTCEKGCLCTWKLGWLVPICKGLCC
ncbi:uncharacterized protein LOC133777753 [Humulus lupulus]|uniref:uncharacterized protein LOC133777753 n=1 Tax=Humulus lupulus TaxID=3486 RepID=UPI002B41264A|nr:uncharacterized protein LOC133777753 [Humulus lupulus]